MIPKSGTRFSGEIMLKQASMSRKSGHWFCDTDMLKKIERDDGVIPLRASS
jgi:hypothetical protein